MATMPRETDVVQSPHIAVARRILVCFRAGGSVDRSLLRRLFEDESGASDASGAWSMRQAYDALELAQTLFVLDPGCPLLASAPRDALAAMEAFVHDLPVQSFRSEEQVALQQSCQAVTGRGAMNSVRVRQVNQRPELIGASARASTYMLLWSAGTPGGSVAAPSASFTSSSVPTPKQVIERDPIA